MTDTLAQPAVIVDATDFRRDPERTMAAYCAAVGIAHRGDALSWEAGAVPEWQSWAEWHREAEQSSGVVPPPPDNTADQVPARVQVMAELCRPYYQRLYAERLTV